MGANKLKSNIITAKRLACCRFKPRSKMSKLSGTPPPSTDDSPVANFLDLQHDIMIPIYKETHFYIGLTTAAELRLVDESHSNAPNDVVATLFKVVRKGRTHWLHTVTSFPCQIDDIDVNDAAPLYQGALIRVADRMFRYQSAWPVYAPDQTLTADDLPDYMNSLEVDMDMPSLSSDWCVVKIPSLADELQESLDSPEQIAHLAASYISQQMVLHTDTSFTSVELDDVFKSIAHVAILDAPMLMKFILAYNKGQCDYRDRKPGDFESTHYSRWIDDNNIDRTLPCSLHAPVIELLKDSLRISLEPIELATLWLKLLEAFSHFTSNLDVMIRHSVTPVVLGAMAVYGDDAVIQALVLSILTKMATYTPLPGVKSPVRESAVELIVMSLKNHPYDVTVVEPAFSTLLTLSQTYSKLIANLLNCGPMLTAVHDCVRRASGLLDYIDHTALPIVKEVSGRHTDNPQIQDYCAKLTTCLQNKLANTTKSSNSTATINASLGLPSDYAVPDQLYAENEERKRKISAHFQPNFTRDYHEKSDEYTINHALSKSPAVENGVYQTIARVPHSPPPRAQDEGIYETIKTIDMSPPSSQTTIQERPRKLWNTSRQPQNMYTEYEPHQFSSKTSSEQSANGDISPLRCKSTASDMGRHSLYTDPSKGSSGVHSPINVVIVDPLTAAHSSSQNTGSPAFRRPDGYLDDLESPGVPASRQVGFSRYVGKRYVSDYGYFDGADSLCHYKNYDSSPDEYYSDIEKYGDGEMQAGYYMVNQDDISSDSEAPELPPRLYNEPERASLQQQHSEDTQVESLSWTPLENNHNDSTTTDSNTDPGMSSSPTGHVTPDPPSHIDPVSCMSSPTNPDMVISGQVNFISDGSSMDNEDFDDFICDIYEGHPEVMDDLKRKYEIINDMSNRWKRDPFAAIQVLSDNASELDMSVTVTLLQTCMKSTTSTEIMMRGIQVASNLLDHPMHPLIADTLCTCIAQVLEGALKEEIDGGWGFFTLRKLHLRTGNILSNEDLPITSGLDQLYRLLDELVTVKN